MLGSKRGKLLLNVRLADVGLGAALGSSLEQIDRRRQRVERSSQTLWQLHGLPFRFPLAMKTALPYKPAIGKRIGDPLARAPIS